MLKNIVEMMMLRWMYGTLRAKIRNKDIRAKVRVVSLVDKMQEVWLRWFGM